MAAPPDSPGNSPTAPSAGTPPENDLTLNDATAAADYDAVSDLRIAPGVDSTQPPPVDLFLADEPDRSWLSRLRSLKTPWKEHPRRSAHNEAVTTDTITNLEKPLASLAALRDICASIDQRLAQVEEASGDKGAIDEALRDVRSQMSDQLVRVEAAVAHLSAIAHTRLEHVEETLRLTRKSLAESVLPEVCANIDRQIVQARMALQRTEEALTDKTLLALCQKIEAQIDRTEGTLRHSESVVATRFEELSGHIAGRFANLEGTLQRTEGAVTDTRLYQLCQKIEGRLDRTEDALHRSEGLVAARLDELSEQLTARFANVEETLQRTKEPAADKALYELCQKIEARLDRTEDALHRSEAAVATRLHELSEQMTAQLASTEAPVQDRTLHELGQNIAARLDRIEDRLHRRDAIVDEWLQTLSASVTASSVDHRGFQAEEPRGLGTSEGGKPAAGSVLAPAAFSLRRFANFAQTNGPIRLPWMAGLVVPVLVLVGAIGIAALFQGTRGGTPEKIATLSTADQIPAPALPAAKSDTPATSPAVIANVSRSIDTGPQPTDSIRENRVSAPQQRSPAREPAPTTTRSSRYVGTLSITSVPSGASVSINGKPAGVTPLKLSGQRAGSLAVQIAHDGFERWSAAVQVPADRLTQVTARLRASAR